MMEKYIKGIAVSIGILWIATSCSKFTEIDPPKNRVGTKQVFADEVSASSAISGIYSVLGSEGFGYGQISALTGLSSDELIKLEPGSDMVELANNDLRAQNTAIADLWSGAYKVIGQANACIEGLEESQSIGAEAKASLIGEAKFLRAFCYSYLMQMFGALPKIQTVSWNTVLNLPRSPQEDIYTLIVDDLNAAYTSLPDQHKSGTKARATKWASAALLARTYLYRGDWDNVLKYANIVVDESGLYQGQLPDIGGIFLLGSEEAIWQMPAPVGMTNTYEGTLYNNSGILEYELRTDLVESFTAEDLRFSTWIAKEDDGMNTYYLPAKYKANPYSDSETEGYVILRLAELFLIRAEAKAHLADYDGAVADLNVVRQRAGLTLEEVPTTEKEVLSMVENELRHEFFVEWGHRWFDLKRWPGNNGNGSRALEVLSPIASKNLTVSDLLYPVPSSEISKNPALAPNNPNY